jgi:hypothetical protein
MATLHVSPATGTPTDLDVESPYNRQPQDVLLKLRFGVFIDDGGTATPRIGGQWDRNLLIDARRHRPAGMRTVLHTRFSAWPLRIGLGPPFGKGRGLTFQRTQRLFQRFFSAAHSRTEFYRDAVAGIRSPSEASQPRSPDLFPAFAARLWNSSTLP